MPGGIFYEHTYEYVHKSDVHVMYIIACYAEGGLLTISELNKLTDSSLGNINNLISHMDGSFRNGWFKEVWNVFLKEVCEISLEELNCVCQEVTALVFSSATRRKNWLHTSLIFC